jgi:excinuclease ABC subunit A
VLDQLKRPDVDFIHGLSPVLAIEQRTGAGGPRSTIATATEIADYAQLLWALAGEQCCPKDGGRVVRRSLDDNVQHVLTRCAGERVMLLAPFMRAKPSVLRDELPRLRQRGFQRVRLNGEIRNLDDTNLVPVGDQGSGGGAGGGPAGGHGRPAQSRLADSLELAFREGKDRALVLAQKSAEAPWHELPSASISRAKFAATSLKSSRRGIFPSTIPRARARPAAGSAGRCASCRS